MGAILRFSALVALLLLTCCAGNPPGGSANVTDSPALPPAGADALSALAQAPAPPGVDAAVWRQLKDELARVVAAAPAAARGVSAPPADDESRATLDYWQSSKTLFWGLYCRGDYDQNGEVGIGDLTPLGIHFGEENPQGPGRPFASTSALAVIDGNGDGVINISDVTPIGMHFGARLQGYHVYKAELEEAYPLSNDAPNGVGTELIGMLPLSAAQDSAGQRKAFSFHIEPEELEHYYWVRPYDGFADGTPSTSLKLKKAPNQPPVAVLQAPGSPGAVPLHISYNAAQSHDPDGHVVRYEWDWDNDGVYDYDTGATPQADFYYYGAGTYTVGLRISDDSGATATATATVIVYPGAIWHREIAAEAAYEPDTRVGGWLNGYWMLGILGKPAFIYITTVNATDGMPVYDNLYYTRAVDSEGKQWNEPLLLDSVKRMEEYGGNLIECLECSEGFCFADKPSVTYWHGVPDSWGGIQYDTRLAVAQDTTGAAWSPQLQIFDYGRPYYGSTIVDCQGLPIYVADGILTGADDPAGSSWTTRYAFPMLGGNNFPCLGMVQGSPAIAVRYPAAEVGNLLYMRALDLEGRQWPKWPTVIAPANSASAGTSYYTPRILQADGFPAIAYYDDNLSMLKYVRALDATGSEWGQPVALDLWTEGWQSVALLEGRPAILYEDSISGEMKLIVANDKAGFSWSFPVYVDLSQSQAASAGHAASRGTSAEISWSQDILMNIGGRLAFSQGGTYAEGTLNHETAEMEMFY